MKIGAASDYTDKGTDIAEVTVSSSTAAATYTLKSDKDANGVVTLESSLGTSQKVLAGDGAQTLSFSDYGITVETGAGFKIGDGTNAASFDGKTIVAEAGAGAGTPFTMLVGASGQQSGADKLDVSLPAIAKLGSDDISTLSAAQTAMTDVDTLLGTVNTFIGKLGAAQSRMDFAQQNLATTIQNTAAAESTIRDADMAAEMTQFTKQQVLAQAGTAMLSQANQASQNVLSLLR
jgi:flagellin